MNFRSGFPAALAAAVMLVHASVPTASAQGLPGGLGNIVGGATGAVSTTVKGVTGAADGLLNALEDPVADLGGASGPASSNEQEFALQAVRSGRAMPLEDIIFIAQLNHEGEVIEVHLITVRSILLYQLTFLAPDGEIFDTFFYAASGISVQTQD